MRRLSPGPSSWLLVLISLAACSADVPASNPFDPASSSPAPGALEGLVLLGGGSPAAGATILRARGGSATADVDGRFRLEAPATPAGAPDEVLTVSAELAGVTYGPVIVGGLRIPIGGVVVVPTVELPLAAGAVVGVVRAAGRPLEGALVTVEGASASVRTLPDGRFELRGAPVGFRRVFAQADGHRFEPVLVDVPAAGAASVEIDGVRFDLSVTHLPAEGAVAGATSVREVNLRLQAADATRARASEDGAFADPARGDLELRALEEPFAVLLADGPDGLRTLRVQAATAAGDRTDRVELPLLLDRAPPALPTTTLPFATSAAALPIGLEAADPAPSSGLAGLSIGIDGRPSERRPLDAPLEVAALDEGLRLVTIAARDAAGNEGPAASLPLVVDRTPPELVSAVELDDGRADPVAGAAREREVVLVFAARDDGRLALASLVCAGCDARFEVELSGAVEPTRVTLAPSADDTLRVPARLLAPSGGAAELTLTLRDPAGNATTATVPYRLDDDPPRIRALGAPAYTNAVSLLPTIEADADAIEARALALPGAACPEGALEGVAFAQLPLAPVALGAQEGPHALCVQVRDAAGNRSEVTLASVVVDRTPPAPLSSAAFAALLLEGDPSPEAGAHVERGGVARAPGMTNEPIAALWFGASDASPLLAQATVADEGVVASFAGLPAVPLLQGALHRALVVLPPGDGVRALHARIVDAAGNELLLPTAGALRIELDRVPPEAPWVRPGTRLVDLPPSTFDVVDALGAAPGAPVTLGVTRLKFNDLDDGLGTRLELYAAFAAPAANAPLGLDAEFRWSDVTERVVPCDATDGCLDVAIRQGTAALGARVTRFFLRAVDAAGNVSAEAPFELEEDSTPPLAPAGLELVPGEGTALARWQPVADVAGYEVWYGAQIPGETSPLRLAGVVAAEGPSPVTTFAPLQQLNGLPDGAPITVAVRAFDRWALEHPGADGHFCRGPDEPVPAGFDPVPAHCSGFGPMVSGWPGAVTPEVLATLPIPGGVRDVVLHDGWAWALGPTDPAQPAVLYTVDLGRPRQPTLVSTLALGGSAQRLSRDGRTICAALGAAGVKLVSLEAPEAPVVLTTITAGTYARDCDLARERLAIAWQGDVLRGRCDPLRDGGVTLHDVSAPQAPALLSRRGYAAHDLLGAATSVLLHGERLYAGVEIPSDVGCPYSDGDLVRLDPLGPAPTTFGDVGEGSEVFAIATDGRTVASARGGILSLHPLGELPYEGSAATHVPTAATAPRVLRFEHVRDLAFEGAHLYVVDVATYHGDRVNVGALEIVDPGTGAIVGRLDVAGAQGLDLEGPGLVVAAAGGLTIARVVSPTEARIAAVQEAVNSTIAIAGPLAVASGGGGSTPVFDLHGGGLARVDGLGAAPGEDQLTLCTAFATAMTRERLVLGCQGGTLQLWRHEAGRLTLQGTLAGLPEVPDRILVDGDRAYVVGRGAPGTELRVLRLPHDGAPEQLGALLLAATPEDRPDLALQGARLFVALQRQGLRLVDVSNPALPVELPLVGGPPAAVGGVALQGRVLFTNSNAAGVNVIAWDVTVPGAPVELGRSSPTVLAGDIWGGPVRASLGVGAAVEFYADAILLDLTDPTAPRLVGGPIEQLRLFGLDLALSDTAFLLASAESLTRIELD